MARKLALSIFFVALISITCVAQSKMPGWAAKARFVYVTTQQGANDGGVTLASEDLQAVTDVENEIRKWQHYQLAFRAADADILLVVRKGRLASVSPGIHVGKRSGRPTKLGPTTEAEAGMPQDYLGVLDAKTGGTLWQRTESQGLTPPRMLLFAQFKDAVEKASKHP
jgi:hypothetical protein